MKQNLKLYSIYFIILVVLLAGVIIVKNTSLGDKIGLNKTEPIKGCYVAKLAKDVYTLNILEQKGRSISGKLDINNYEKDSSIGTIIGKYKNGILLADYTFQSEGIESVNQVAFKKIGNNFVRGYGQPDDETGTRFVDTSKIVFDTSVVYYFSENDCL
jgi:hypothetical protein